MTREDRHGHEIPSLERTAAIRNSADTDLGMFRVKAVFEEH